MPRRSYDHYCAVSRTLDAVGERWTLLIVRELLAGPRRYTDLHADLPGVSTDVLASRLRDMERDGLVIRRRITPRSAATAYSLTARGRDLLPVLRAFADWGAAGLSDRHSTDAFRAHWLALPLAGVLENATDATGTVEIRLGSGTFHIFLGSAATAAPEADRVATGYGDGPASRPDARIDMDDSVCTRLIQGSLSLADAIAAGEATVQGATRLAEALSPGAGHGAPVVPGQACEPA